MRKFRSEPADAGGRADVFVASKYPEFTRSSLELLFDKGLITINGKPAKAASRIVAGDTVEVDETPLRAEPPAIDLPVIYEDDDVIVINKPAGVLTHSKGALNLEGTVASFIKPQLRDKSLSGNRAGIVHRLDRGTSGVILTVKNAESLKKLQKQFNKRSVKKVYLAVVEGVPKPEEAVIDVPIGRNPARPQTFKTMSGGKPAVTSYKVLKAFSESGKDFSLVRLEPKTGRTHQLRVHLKYIGHPIVGDNIYGHGGGRLMLHAKSLEVTLPSGERKVFESSLPEEFGGV